MVNIEIVQEPVTLEVATAGTQGLQGPAGAQGPAGTNGTNGTGVVIYNQNPDGNVTANEGTLLTVTGDTNVTKGPSLWVKTANNFSSGWKVLQGDTGQRDITALWVAAGWAWYGYGQPHLIRMRRVGNLVTVSGSAFGGQGADPYKEIVMPTGFGPTYTTVDKWVNPNNLSQSIDWTILPAALRAGGYMGSNVTGQCSWITDAEWPTTLPGTAV